jgi:hypothetical protein
MLKLPLPPKLLRLPKLKLKKPLLWKLPRRPDLTLKPG